MKIKFNHFERVAGLFVLAALVGSLAGAAGIAVKKGWFASKIPFDTFMQTAEGIHPGTVVQIAGLRAGAVDDVELISAEKILVRIKVFEKFHDQIRADSFIQVLRPFVIGEKVLEISVGTEGSPRLEPGAQIVVKSSFDIMDLVSGKKLGPFIGTLEKLSDNLRILGEAFADPERTKAFVNMFDKLAPLIANLNNMASGVVKITDAATKQRRIEILLSNLTNVSTALNQILPAMVTETPDIGKQMGHMVGNLNDLTTELQKLTPAIAAIAPELPKTSLRAVEALNETVILLKALQKSFLLRGKVEEVREQERMPAAK
jgi:phospholipid/cholesterol/gamma-HCH transport system substrate-binding protein